MKRGALMLVLTTTMSIFGFGQSKSDYKVEAIFTDLRKLSFSIAPEELGLNITDDKKVFAVFMETGYPEAAFSLRCMGEGTISIYFTNGGGMIGIGQHDAPRAASLKLIEMSDSFLKRAKLTTVYELPKPGFTKFYFRTRLGVYTYEEKEEILGNRKSDYSPLFFQAQDVITKAREIEEAKHQ